MAALLAGLPDTVAGVTVNRLCASGLSAVVSACHAVAAGDGDLFVAGGVESMSRAPLVMAKPERAFPRGDQTVYDTTLGWRFAEPAHGGAVPARVHGRDGRERRRALERVARGSGRVRARARSSAGPRLPRRAGSTTSSCPSATSTRDEHPRPDTSAEKLAALRPAFHASGTVTAGNSSGINDGAAALVIASEERARELGAEPLGRFRGSAVAGVDPRVMGIGPVPAVRKLLERAGVDVADLDLVELNEAFASQSLAVIRELGLDEERVNVNGGAIALGHPLGHERRPARRLAAPRAAPPRRPARAGDALRRRRPGPGRALGALVVSVDELPRRAERRARRSSRDGRGRLLRGIARLLGRFL